MARSRNVRDRGVGPADVTAAVFGAGFALMAGEWEAAVKAILMARSGERDDVAAARRLFWDAGDPAGAAAQLPMRMGAERACLQVHFVALHYPESLCGAAVPRLPPGELVAWAQGVDLSRGVHELLYNNVTVLFQLRLCAGSGEAWGRTVAGSGPGHPAQTALDVYACSAELHLEQRGIGARAHAWPSRRGGRPRATKRTMAGRRQGS